VYARNFAASDFIFRKKSTLQRPSGHARRRPRAACFRCGHNETHATLFLLIGDFSPAYRLFWWAQARGTVKSGKSLCCSAPMVGVYTSPGTSKIEPTGNVRVHVRVVCRNRNWIGLHIHRLAVIIIIRKCGRAQAQPKPNPSPNRQGVFSHCRGGGGFVRCCFDIVRWYPMQNIGFLEFFVKEKTKTRAPTHLRNHSKSVGIARTLLIWQGRHVRPRYAYVACWFRGIK